MHRIIPASLIALALLATACERQPESKPALQIYKNAAKECSPCLDNKSEDECARECTKTYTIDGKEHWFDYIDRPVLDAEPNLSVISINGEPIIQKKVEAMAIGEEGWIPSIYYRAEASDIIPHTTVLSRKTSDVMIRIKRTEAGFEVTVPKDEPTQGDECSSLRQELERIMQQIEKDKAI